MKRGFYAVVVAILGLVGCVGGSGAEDVRVVAAADAVSWRGVVFDTGTSEQNYAAAAALDPCVLEYLYPGVQGPYQDPYECPTMPGVWAYAFSSDSHDDVEGALTACGHGSEIQDLPQEVWYPLPCGEPFPPCP